MKIQKNLLSPRKGFTLIEMLVVMAIIAILAGLIFTGVGLGLKKVKLLQAQRDIAGIVDGVENFYADHNYLPINDGATEIETTTTAADGIYMIEALTRRGTGAEINKKGTDYFNTKTSDSGQSGLILSAGGGITGLYDPFKRPYNFVIDTDLDNRILDPTGSTQIAGKILVWSFGVDGPSSDEKEWVYSWK